MEDKFLIDKLINYDNTRSFIWDLEGAVESRNKCEINNMLNLYEDIHGAAQRLYNYYRIFNYLLDRTPEIEDYDEIKEIIENE